MLRSLPKNNGSERRKIKCIFRSKCSKIPLKRETGNIMKRKRIQSNTYNTDSGSPRLLKKILSTVLIVGLAAATTFLAGMTADEEAARIENESFGSKPAIEYVVEMPSSSDIILEEMEKNKYQRARSKKWSLLSVPMWLIGHLISLLLTPLIGKLLTYVFIIAVFFGILCLCLKIMFPDTPLRELLTKRTLLTFFCCTGVFIAALHIPALLDMNADYHGLFSFLAGALAILTMVLLCTDPKKKEETAEA